MSKTEMIWIGIGFFGQALFSMRFIIQWIVSEKNKKSVIPNTFWYFSILGGITLLSYAIYKKDPVFITGQLAGLFIYLRNIHLIHRCDTQTTKQDIASDSCLIKNS